MVTGWPPFLVRSDFEINDAFHPTAGQKDVVDVEAAFLAMPEIISWPGFGSVTFEEECVIGANQASRGE